jgi:hypothetical protein
MRVTRTANDIAWTAGLVLALAWAAMVYRPILGGYFFGDDFGSLFLATNRAPLEYILEPVPGHIQYIPRTTYYTLLRLIGPDPRWFFALMLGTHLANVGLLYAVGYALTGFPALACLGAALWGSLRINEGTLGWYTVIGQAFATLLILIVLHGLSRAERRGTLSTREASGWFALLLLSCVSFGTAMPVAALFPFVAWTVLPPGTASRGARRVLWSLSLAVPVTYVITYALYLRAYGHDDKYAKFFLGYVFNRSYWVRVSAGTLQLLRAGLTSLIYGVTTMPRAVSKASYLVPITLALLLAGAAASRIRERRWIGALVLLTVSVYAMVAFGRAAFYRDNLADLGWVARYHYQATALLALASVLAVARVVDGLRRAPMCAAALLALWLGGTAVAWTRGDWVIDLHVEARAATEATLASISSAIANAPGTGPAFIPNRAFQPSIGDPFELGGWAGFFSIFAPDGTGRRVFFVETRPEVRARAAPGSPMAALLFPPA